ncbi:MAG TPA: HD domain-containing phosphohydrolase [Tepidisphaeraceae bacterium]|jgi:putative nucleotidyltransferase with HDIG domain|nr:HD domain-containing phosphohydrolase [Tepidisphaeraceae bacterium]
MATVVANSPAEKTTASPIPVAALDNLAARFRPGGLFLVMLRPDGTVAYHDPAAGVFFTRYVLPLLQYRDSSNDELRSKVQSLAPTSSVVVWNDLPGVTLAAFPYLEKKQQLGVLLVAGKGSSFRLGEDVVRVCSRLGLDGIWLNQQADELPSYTDEQIIRQGRLVLSMVRDQVRLAGMEQELDSLSGQLANTYEELSLIYQLSSGMKINRRAGDFFKQACLDVMEVMTMRGMGVALRADSFHKQEPVLYGALSLPPGKVHRLAEELMIILAKRKSPLLINHLAKDKTLNWLAEHATQLLAVPLMRQEQVLGCLFGIDKQNGEFDTVDSKLLNSIANESAIYLENAMLFDDVRGLMMGLLHSLTSAVDAKDTYTCGHSERVALLSRSLALEAGLTEQQVERIYMAGLLHDVGKIGVPEAVLQKTGKLTPEEFEQIKKHPEIGARILKDIKQVEDIIPGVMHHHERYDGKGYPAGLSGENIPLMGRIICLADCFDAMTSSRTYRKALPLEVALTEIRRCSGTQFDPVLSDAFLRLSIDQLRELIRDHQEQSKKLIDLHQVVR